MPRELKGNLEHRAVQISDKIEIQNKNPSRMPYKPLVEIMKIK